MSIKLGDELRKKLLSRIDHLKTEVEHGRKLMINNPYNGKVWEGRVSAIEGVDGEIKFLEKLLEEDELSV